MSSSAGEQASPHQLRGRAGAKLVSGRGGLGDGRDGSGHGFEATSMRARDKLMSFEPNADKSISAKPSISAPSLTHAGPTPLPPSPTQPPLPALSGAKTATATSGTQRLGSIEILNENRQRQLQIEQQESFKQHLEQRQKFIQSQQQQQKTNSLLANQQEFADRADENFQTPYRIETEAPLYARMAGAASGGQTPRAPTNPFNDPKPASASEPGLADEDNADAAAKLSGRSGFIAALMGDSDQSESSGLERTVKHRLVGGEETTNTKAEDESRIGVGGEQTAESRYSKLTQSRAHSYNYESDGGALPPDAGLPFYKRELASILQECRGSRKLVILIVAIALLLDNMLLTSVVPIIPAYLYKLRIEREHREQLQNQLNGAQLNGSGSSVSGTGPVSGPLDQDELIKLAALIHGKTRDEVEAELEARINQSLANVQDRFSGSFFHPRVVGASDRARGHLDIDGDDGEDDDDGRGASGNDGEGDDDGGNRDGRESDGRRAASMGAQGQRRTKARNRLPRAEGAPASLGRGKAVEGRATRMRLNEEDYEAANSGSGRDDDDDDDDDGDNDDDDHDDNDANASRGASQQKSDNSARAKEANKGEGSERRKNGKFDRKKSGGKSVDVDSSSQRRPTAGTSTMTSPARPTGGREESRSGLNGRESQRGGRRDDDSGKAKQYSEGRGNASEESDEEDDDEDVAELKHWTKVRDTLTAKAKMFGNDSDALGDMCLSMVFSPPPAAPVFRARSKSLAKTNNGDEDDENDVEEVDGNGFKGMPPLAGGRAAENRRRFKSGEGGGAFTEQPVARVERVRSQRGQKARGGRKQAAVQAGESSLSQPPSTSTIMPSTIIGDDEVIISHQDIVDESFEVGVMFASKPIVQAIANPFVGAITNRVGFTVPMFVGFTIMFLSTLVFAFGSTYGTLFLARAIQGVGSACTSVAGMSMIADRFPDDAERGNAMAIALGGLALGVVVGPPFGGFMYEFFGKPSPFIVLAALALMDGLLQLLVLQPRVSKSQDEGASLLTLIKDPYILVAAGAITFANTGIGILEPALPLWMMDTMQAKNWEQGVAFLPAALSYLFSTNLFGNLGLRIGRWRSAMIGLIIIGASLLLIPFASRVDHLILPNGAIGFAIGMVDSTMMPMLGYLVDIRHTSVYGSVYAIGDVAFCASFVFGPALSGTLVELIGFEGLIITTAIICFAFAPLLLLLRNPPARSFNEAQMQEQTSLRYVNFATVGQSLNGHGGRGGGLGGDDDDDEEEDENDLNEVQRLTQQRAGVSVNHKRSPSSSFQLENSSAAGGEQTKFTASGEGNRYQNLIMTSSSNLGGRGKSEHHSTKR